jgi:hypothetical protein
MHRWLGYLRVHHRASRLKQDSQAQLFCAKVVISTHIHQREYSQLVSYRVKGGLTLYPSVEQYHLYHQFLSPINLI